MQQFIIRSMVRDGLHIGDGEISAIGESLTVIIPARNEAGRIGETLRALLQQQYPGLRVLVVDDRSEDATLDIVRQVSTGDDRVSAMRIEALPPGWMGKSHALWCASQQIDTDWILFLDADCHVLPRGLLNAMRYALHKKADVLSLWPRDGSRGFWERLLLPLCGAMIVIWYGRSARDSDNGGTVAFANGQFILVKRDAYMTVDGHRGVRAAIIEDIPLAKRLKANGYRVLSAIGADICVVRMYESLGELVRGWQRIYIGVLTPTQIGLCMLSIVIGSLAPFVLVPICALQTIHGGSVSWQIFLALSVAHFIALMATSIRFFGIAHCRLRYLCLYPLSCVGVLAILGAAFARSVGHSSIEWRGTRYEIRRSNIES